MTRQEWLKQRHLGLGGSDAPAVLGLDPRKSRFSLWVEKTHPLEVANGEPDEAPWLEWGKRLEDAIAKKYSDETGRLISNPGDFKIFSHQDRDWQQATVDRLVLDDELALQMILELKTANNFMAWQWKDGPPLHYQVQLQHYLATLGAKRGSIAVLIGGQKYQHFDFDRDQDFCSLLVAEEEEFWDLVTRGVAPEVDGSKATEEAIKRLYPKEQLASRPVILPKVSLDWDEELQEIGAKMRELGKRKKELSNQIKDLIGDAPAGLLPRGEHSWSWKTETRGPYEAREAKEIRMLRRVKA